MAIDPAGASDCPEGGVIVSSGMDKNRDGILEFEEVDVSRAICNGSSGNNGAGSLISSSPLDLGDTHCPAGGAQVDAGVDDNVNGTLDATEIDSTEYVCSAHDGGSLKSLTPPEGSAGTATVDVSGGAGTVSNGGGGGQILIHSDRGTMGGHIKLFKTGSADPSLAIPNLATPQLGSRPYTVPSSVEVPVATSQDDAAPGLFLLPDIDSLRLKNNGVTTEVSGLSIPKGVVVTFHANSGSNVDIKFYGDVDNAGTIRTKASIGSSATAPLLLTINGSYIGRAGSLINTSPGSDGESGADVTIKTSSAIYNAGMITASGAPGDPAGNGGNVSLSTVGSIYNSGAITTRGGSGLGTGGTGGNVAFDLSLDGVLFNSGAIEVSGGNGGTDGGASGSIALDPHSAGAAGIRNSGDLIAKGGDATCTASNCSGGKGGDVTFMAYGPMDVINNAKITLDGGSGHGTGSGGDAGTLTATAPGGDLIFSGNIGARGGHGGNGGKGGKVELVMSPQYYANGQEIILFGYKTLITNGGTSAHANGGYAGNIKIYWDHTPNPGLPTGAVVNYLDIEAMGGGSDNGNGGVGAIVTLSTNIGKTADFKPGDYQRVYNYGSIKVQGGSGQTGGGGGLVDLFGSMGVENRGTLNCSGGNGNTYGGSATYAGSETSSLRSDGGVVENSGDITCEGGNASSQGQGASGGHVILSGREVHNKAAISLKGGDGNALDGTGGGGGDLEIVTLDGVYVNAGQLTVTSGTGHDNAGPGSITVNGLVVKN